MVTSEFAYDEDVGQS